MSAVRAGRVVYLAVVLPIVWIFGASGVGKSTVGFQTLLQLADEGIPAALVDADQLRLARGLDATETELIAAALPRLEQEFRSSGARVVIVTGVADDAGHLSSLLAGVEGAGVFTVHLDVDAATLRRRIRQRGSLLHEMEENVRAAAALDPAWADLRVATTGRSPEELAAEIAARTQVFVHSAQDSGPAAAATRRATAPRHAVLIAGPGGVGLSTAGYATFSRIAALGRRAAYLDAYQLGFLNLGSLARELRSAALAPMRARNVRAVAGVLRDAGAEVVVVTGDARTMRLLHDSWGGGATTAVWLHASREALEERIVLRARGQGPGIPGDHRAGLDGQALDEAIDEAVAELRGLDEMPGGTATIDTSAMDVGQLAEAIARLATGHDPTAR